MFCLFVVVLSQVLVLEVSIFKSKLHFISDGRVVQSWNRCRLRIQGTRCVFFTNSCDSDLPSLVRLQAASTRVTPPVEAA